MALNVSRTYLDGTAELERLGYSAGWLPGGQIDDLGRLAEIARATTTVRVASAIVELDVYPAELVADFYTRLEASAPVASCRVWAARRNPDPAVLNDYLDRLDHAEPPVPTRRRILAALGPRKLELARHRSAGAILLLATDAYTRTARRILGNRHSLVIDQMLVLDTDATRARHTARRPLRFLSGLRGYRASFTRMGFTDTDIDAPEASTWSAPPDERR